MVDPPFASDTPFGASPRLAPTTGMAVIGCVNLLVKTAAAWSAGHDAKATGLLDRAGAMPFVSNETVWPGPYAAHLMMFELLTHTVETGESHDWFAAVEATYAGLDDQGRTWLSDALAPVVDDWDLAPDLARLVGDLVAGRSDELRWMRDDLDPATVRSATESVLRTVVRLADELGSRGLCSHLKPERW